MSKPFLPKFFWLSFILILMAGFTTSPTLLRGEMIYSGGLGIEVPDLTGEIGKPFDVDAFLAQLNEMSLREVRTRLSASPELSEISRHSRDAVLLGLKRRSGDVAVGTLLNMALPGLGSIAIGDFAIGAFQAALFGIGLGLLTGSVLSTDDNSPDCADPVGHWNRCDGTGWKMLTGIAVPLLTGAWLWGVITPAAMPSPKSRAAARIFRRSSESKKQASQADVTAFVMPTLSPIRKSRVPNGTPELNFGLVAYVSARF